MLLEIWVCTACFFGLFLILDSCLFVWMLGGIGVVEFFSSFHFLYMPLNKKNFCSSCSSCRRLRRLWKFFWTSRTETSGGDGGDGGDGRVVKSCARPSLSLPWVSRRLCYERRIGIIFIFSRFSFFSLFFFSLCYSRVGCGWYIYFSPPLTRLRLTQQQARVSFHSKVFLSIQSGRRVIALIYIYI